MKKNTVTGIVIGLSAIVLVTLGYFYFNSSGRKADRPTFVNSAFAEYISSYTAGVVSTRSPLRIIFASDMADSAMVGKEVNQKLFAFTPSIKGKAFWLDRRTIEFRPEQRLSPGTKYQAEFLLSKIRSVPRELETFQYTFQTIAQNFEVRVTNLKPYEARELKRQKIEGVLLTADDAEDDVVEKAFRSHQGNNALKVSWVHSGEGKQHHFTIEEVERKTDASSVVITVDGSPLGIKETSTNEVEIPAVNDFKLLHVDIIQSPTQQIVLRFSDPLKDGQTLQGLVTLDGGERLDFDIEENLLRIYPATKISGKKTVRIESAIRNLFDRKLKERAIAEVLFEELSPAVRFTGQGSILPSANGLVLPFEAVNLNSVDVTVFRIFEKNILQFLQVNSIGDRRELYRVGKRVTRKMIALDKSGVTDFNKWNRYTLDLSEIIQPEPGAIYQVQVSFRKQYASLPCIAADEDTQEFPQYETEPDPSVYYDGYYDDDYYYYYDDYDWRERNNPCHQSYYTQDRFISKNLLASDFGLTAKRGDDGRTLAFITDLSDANPAGGVTVELYNFQQQLLETATTSSDGKVEFNPKDQPFVIIARKGGQRGYLKLTDGEALSTSSFEISGESVQRGLKGFLYGDRGVWRPGDSLHLTFILEDKVNHFPDNHPVVFELQNPQGQITNRIVRASSVNGFYSFATATSADAPTGNWTGRVKAGAFTHTQTLKIETIKPNRLKINLDFGVQRFDNPKVSGELQVNWLHGPPGRNLKAEFDMTMVKVPTTFKEYPSYTFEDASRGFYSETQSAFDGFTDSEGKASMALNLDLGTPPPGFLQVVLRGKVFEESGNFSIDRLSIPYSPYKSYVGMKLPEGEKYSGILYFDKQHAVELVTCDADGKGVSRNNLDVKLFKLDWRWWWDNSGAGIANYVNGSSSRLIKRDVASTRNGKGVYTLLMKSDTEEYGRYYLQVCDPASGHCTGKVIYIDEPGWYSRMRGSESGAPNLISFSAEKTNYNVGETVKLGIPTPAKGRALVSIENGSRVLSTEWIDTAEGETSYSFKATAEMTPNVYVHVSVMQPHSQTLNELPIRLYGVTGVNVENEGTRLEPLITMPDELESGKEVVIQVSEKSRRKMTYTVAVVDEGLLDITRFKTPDPWSRFYAKEALGVKTWDMFDQVIGAYGNRLERVLTVGGDEDATSTEGDPRANRFKPVVKFFGPFTYDGKTQTHRFTMPQYIGSVRTMVVAGYEGAYGKAEKAVPVRKPLMVLATLPRVLGPEETVKLPVTIFTERKDVRNVKLSVKTSGPVQVSGGNSQDVAMPASGEVTADFQIRVKPEMGVARISVTASSGSYTAEDVIEIDIRNPNQPVTRILESFLEEGKSWETDVVPFGIAGTNSATLEVSNLPPLNLASRLRHLVRYPYGCVEQTTSSVFPQLYVGLFKEVSDQEKQSIQANVTAGIDRLKSMALRDGGFSYWPGGEDADSWGTSYAGHFLLEASEKGYYVPDDILRKWKTFQAGRAEAWQRDTRYFNNDLQQAYRLYTLSLAGSPALGAMNRLREDGELSNTAAWMLAAAYAKVSQFEAAKELVAGLNTNVKSYRELSYSYGSAVRDKALILETLVLLNDRTKAFEVLKEISQELSDPQRWMSTQESAMCLKAVAAFAGSEKRGDLSYTYTVNGKATRVVSKQPLSQIMLPVADGKNLRMSIESNSSAPVFVRLITEGTPARGDEDQAENNLSLTVNYSDMRGNPIDVSQLAQGTEFMAEVTVRHHGVRSSYENLALAQVFPSGWEITNLRLNDDQALLKTDGFDYQDIRDDRVYTYFGLRQNERKTFRVMLTASYAGTYYHPAISCEAMYDRSIYARRKGFEVQVIKAGTP